jgi:hypothetical protein
MRPVLSNELANSEGNLPLLPLRTVAGNQKSSRNLAQNIAICQHLYATPLLNNQKTGASQSQIAAATTFMVQSQKASSNRPHSPIDRLLQPLCALSHSSCLDQ